MTKIRKHTISEFLTPVFKRAPVDVYFEMRTNVGSDHATVYNGNAACEVWLTMRSPMLDTFDCGLGYTQEWAIPGCKKKTVDRALRFSYARSGDGEAPPMPDDASVTADLAEVGATVEAILASSNHRHRGGAREFPYMSADDTRAWWITSESSGTVVRGTMGLADGTTAVFSPVALSAVRWLAFFHADGWSACDVVSGTDGLHTFVRYGVERGDGESVTLTIRSRGANLNESAIREAVGWVNQNEKARCEVFASVLRRRIPKREEEYSRVEMNIDNRGLFVTARNHLNSLITNSAASSAHAGACRTFLRRDQIVAVCERVEERDADGRITITMGGEEEPTVLTHGRTSVILLPMVPYR